MDLSFNGLLHRSKPHLLTLNANEAFRHPLGFHSSIGKGKELVSHDRSGNRNKG